jgi:pyruvate-formate lyase-activating enzyme
VLHELSKSGLPVKLDTNGMLPEAVELMLEEAWCSASPWT